MKKITSIFLLAGMVGCLISGCGSDDSGNINTSENTVIQEEKTESKEVDESSSTNNLEVIPSEISDIYTVSIDGATYKLPCKVSDFIGNGWELGEEYQNAVVDETGTDTLFVHKDVEGQYIQLDLGVYSVKVGTRVEDLYVGKISVNEGQGVDVAIADITIGSTYNDVKKMAEPYAVSTLQTEDTNGRICVKYHFVEDGEIELVEGGYETIEFVLDPDTEEVFQIIMQFYPALM